MERNQSWKIIYKMKKITIVILFLIVLLFVVSEVKAADYSLTCTYGSGCSPSLYAFFPASEVWYPGKILTKMVQFTNNSSVNRKIGVQATHTSTSGNIDRVVDLVITKSDSTILFSNSLNAFYTSGEIALLDSLPAHSSETFSFRATMYTTSGNEYQNKTTQFDLIIGFISSPTGQGGQVAGAWTSSASSAGEVRGVNVKQGISVWKYVLIVTPILLSLLLFIIKLNKKNKT